MMGRFWLAGMIVATFVVSTPSSAWQQEGRAGLAEIFTKLDADGDGGLNQEELGRPQAFARMDADGDGKVTQQELVQTLREATLNQRRRVVTAIARKAGIDPIAQAGAMRQVEVDPAIKVTRGLVYRDLDGADANAISLDIYAPQRAENLPVLAFVHGGGWAIGDKAGGYTTTHSRYFTGRGMIYISLNYRLLPQGRHPNNVEDVAAAVAWIHDHIADFGGDPDQIVIMGHSAGAHLVALAATDDRHLQKFGKDLSIIKGVIANDTQTYDIDQLLEGRRIGGRLYINAFGDKPEGWRDASPVTHVEPGKSIPPFLILHNVNDASRTSRAAQGKTLADALKRAGGSAKVVAIPKRTHGQLNQQMGLDGESTTKEVGALLDEVLR